MYARFYTVASACLVVAATGFAQQDSTQVLNEVIVTAYRSNRPIVEVPVAVVKVTAAELTRFANISLLPAVNTIAGVRMEERSPGSYRFSIRGSVLRSPFGVRNVKFYWNGLPFTDAGGNTYLNIFDFGSIGTMEITKGPGASLYGAGTGGVVLLSPRAFAPKPEFNFSAVAGSYGLLRMHAHGTLLTTEKNKINVGIGFQKADGYREQSEMNRWMAHLQWNYAFNTKSELATSFFSSRLFYQTPGGLNQTQFNENPRQARQATPTIPGAIEQKAAVTNNTTYLGTTYSIDWNKNFSSSLGVNGSFTDFENPTIRNYETRAEKNAGLRTETSWQIHPHLKITGGAEGQWFQSQLNVFGNNQGTKTDVVFSKDALRALQLLAFIQTDLELGSDFFATLGGSVNNLTYRDQPLAGTELSSNFKNELSPRVALLKKLSSIVSVYANVSRGFSPPTFSEALPSSGNYNPNLNAESGTSYEVGLRAFKVAKQINFEVVAYQFNVKNAIVIQREEDGAEYFINAGSTRQQGIESTFSWTPVFNTSKITSSRFFATYTLNRYFFDTYVQDGTDFSGKRLTGVAPDIFVTGLDFSLQNGTYFTGTLNYTNHIPLNDANSVYASDYWLLAAKAGYRNKTAKLPYDVFIGADNLLNETYSLGNDLNAIGGRYYNATAPRNFFAGVTVSFSKK